jgi:uncharacterized protein with TBP-like fold DUF4468
LGEIRSDAIRQPKPLNMKRLLTAALLLVSFVVQAQTSGPFGYKSEDKYMYYSNVVQVDTSFTISDLYKDAKLYITKLALTNVKITTDDKVGGTVAIDVEEPTTFKTQTGIGTEPMTLKYSVKFELKKGRYRYTFDNIFISYQDKSNKAITQSLYELDKDKGGGPLGIGRGKRILTAMDDLFESKISLMAKTMSKKSDDF